MNRKEREQVKILEQVKLGRLTQIAAARKLGITDRWVRAKMNRYRLDGDVGLIHKSRGKESKKRWSAKEEHLLIALLQKEWHGFGPTFATEKLFELYGIKVSKETARKAMIRASLWHPKKQRRQHRKRRERKPMFGMMIQLDGSPHDWFEGRGPRCTLVVFIDDATSSILWLEFVPSESTEALMQSTKNYVEKYGVPDSFYTDFGAVFHVNLNNAEHEKKTQWERAISQLDSTVCHAHSPQAKGRVERCNQTMQDRLIKEMRLAGISSLEEANEYVKTSSFIEKHNQKFAVIAQQNGDAHRSVQLYDLDAIFCIQETRILANDFTITYNKRIFQLHDQQKTIVRPKNNIVVKTDLSGTISLWIRTTKLSFNEINVRQSLPRKENIINQIPRKPSINSRRWVAGLLPLSILQESSVKPALPAVEAL